MKTSDSGIALIEEFEGLRLEAYPDPGSGGDPWTIGYGHTAGVHPGDTCTKEQADEWLRSDIAFAEAAVDHLVTVPLKQAQFDPLVSFVFNLGQGAFGGSTLLRRLNMGKYEDVPDQFRRWVNGPNGPMPGLVRRRDAEAKMFAGAV